MVFLTLGPVLGYRPPCRCGDSREISGCIHVGENWSGIIATFTSNGKIRAGEKCDIVEDLLSMMCFNGVAAMVQEAPCRSIRPSHQNHFKSSRCRIEPLDNHRIIQHYTTCIMQLFFRAHSNIYYQQSNNILLHVAIVS